MISPDRKFQDAMDEALSHPERVTAPTLGGDKTFKICSVSNCEWKFDCTGDQITEIAVAGHMLEHTPRELFETINKLSGLVNALQNTARGAKNYTQALDEFITEWEAEHGPITEEEVEAAEKEWKNSYYG